MFDRLRAMFRPAPAPAPRRRSGYAAGQLSRLAAFSVALEAAHADRQRDLARMRAHSRQLTKDNVYHRRFIDLVSTNIVGENGIGFESEITSKDGKPQETANDAIEASYREWCQACTVDGKLSRAEMEQLVAETVAQDGEHLIRLVRGFPNRWRFAVELVDADRLDHEYNTVLSNGNRVIMGVEVDAWGRPLAYYLWTAHPNDYEAGARKRVRVPAGEILHVYREDRARATRGVPWSVASMVQLNMLGSLWTAELAAANWEANRLGVIKDAADAAGETDTATTAEEISSEMATFVGLDAGQDVVFPAIQHPNGQLPAFSLALLKGIAAGLGVSYHSLAGDVSDANYSSARVALLEERDRWRKLQKWFIRSVSDPIFRAWLDMAVLSGAVSVSGVEPSRLCSPSWWPRTWAWVDPEKDVKSSVEAIEKNLSTHQRELSQQGLDWRDVFKQRALEDAYRAELKPAAVVDEAAAPVQDTALNGAQVASLLEIINAVAVGTLPKLTAEAMILAAFPGVEQAQVAAMLAPIQEGSTKPKPEKPQGNTPEEEP